MSKSIGVQEKAWQAESDARTLADAEEIKSDKKRLNAAVSKAKKLAVDATKEAKRLTIIQKPVTKQRKRKGGSNIRKKRGKKK